jgi:PKD repeat protein
MAVFAATGCGGGSMIAQSVPVTQPSVTATPAGTYTITLTSTATTTNGAALAAVPPTQLTLIVN